MALSVKVALLTCLFFTGGICWLVNQVARPADGRLQALATRPPERAVTPLAAGLPSESARPALLERESPVARAREYGEPASRTVVVPEIALAGEPTPDRPIPPLHNPLLEMRTAAAAAQQQVIVADAPVEGVPDAVFAMEIPTSALLEARRPTLPYVVQKGDSLSRICRSQYGEKSAEGQRLVLADNPQIARRARQTIFEGETLQIPQIDGMPGSESDSGGMEASATFVTQIVPEPEQETLAAKPAAKRPERAGTANRVVRTPPKSDTVRKGAKSSPGKAAAKASQEKSSGRATANGSTARSKSASKAQATRDERSSKANAAAARRSGPPSPKAASGKRAPTTDKKDARRAGGNVVLARRE